MVFPQSSTDKQKNNTINKALKPGNPELSKQPSLLCRLLSPINIIVASKLWTLNSPHSTRWHSEESLRIYSIQEQINI